MSNKLPRKHLDLSVLHLDNSRGLPYVPHRADDPEVIAMRRSWPEGTVVLAQQATGAAIAHEIAAFPFTNKYARQQAFQLLSTALVNSAWHSYPEQSAGIMRSVVDLPQLAYDPQDGDDEAMWRETERGSLDKLRHGLGATAIAALQLINRHIQGRNHEATARTFSRYAASSAVRMATMGMLSNQPDTRSAVDIQNDVRTLGLSLLDEARYAYEQHGNHPTLAQLADDPRDSWLLGAPRQTQDAFNSAFERIAE